MQRKTPSYTHVSCYMFDNEGFGIIGLRTFQLAQPRKQNKSAHVRHTEHKINPLGFTA